MLRFMGSLDCGETHLENDIAAQTTVAKLRVTTMRNGCSVTMVFQKEPNPHIQESVTEMLLRSMEKRSEATCDFADLLHRFPHEKDEEKRG